MQWAIALNIRIPPVEDTVFLRNPCRKSTQKFPIRFGNATILPSSVSEILFKKLVSVSEIP